MTCWRFARAFTQLKKSRRHGRWCAASCLIGGSPSTKAAICMVVQPNWRDRIVACGFPLLSIGVSSIQFVSEFKYLGHVINSCMSDDDDISREIRNMFTPKNVLLCQFGSCSVPVKLSLFKTYCLNLYDIALWHTYLKGSMQKLRSCYNSCVKMFFSYSRNYSMTQTLFELNIPSFDTLLFNSSVRFLHCWHNCNNDVVKHLSMVLN